MRDIAKAYEPDRYLASLLAPKSVREDLITLAAFLSELRKISLQVSEPLIGEIRFQWWRDALEAVPSNLKTGNPVADKFADLVRRYNVPQNLLSDLLDVHGHALHSASSVDDVAFDIELELTEGLGFRIAARILGYNENQDMLNAIVLASRCYGRARAGLTLPISMSHGRYPLPRQTDAKSYDEADCHKDMGQLCAEAAKYLQEFRAIMANLSGDRKALTTALLPVAVTEPYLKALQRADHDPSRDIAEIAPLTRVWRLCMAHAIGQI